MPVYRALIFDLDGTVVDSHAYTFAAFRHACAPYREPPSDADVFGAFGPSERVILGALLRPEVLEVAYARLQAYYALHALEVGVHPAMRPLLADLRTAGVGCALFTGRGGDSTRLLLSKLDLAWAFTAVLSGDAVQRPKPAPDGVLELLQRLGLAAKEVLVVGDSRLDLEAAAAAGTSAVFAAWHPWAGGGAGAGTQRLEHPDALRPLVGLAAGTG